MFIIIISCIIVRCVSVTVILVITLCATCVYIAFLLDYQGFKEGLTLYLWIFHQQKAGTLYMRDPQ